MSRFTQKIKIEKDINNNGGHNYDGGPYLEGHDKHTIPGSWEAEKSINQRDIYKVDKDRPINKPVDDEDDKYFAVHKQKNYE